MRRKAGGKDMCACAYACDDSDCEHENDEGMLAHHHYCRHVLRMGPVSPRRQEVDSEMASPFFPCYSIFGNGAKGSKKFPLDGLGTVNLGATATAMCTS